MIIYYHMVRWTYIHCCCFFIVCFLYSIFSVILLFMFYRTNSCFCLFVYSVYTCCIFVLWLFLPICIFRVYMLYICVMVVFAYMLSWRGWHRGGWLDLLVNVYNNNNSLLESAYCSPVMVHCTTFLLNFQGYTVCYWK